MFADLDDQQSSTKRVIPEGNFPTTYSDDAQIDCKYNYSYVHACI